MSATATKDTPTQPQQASQAKAKPKFRFRLLAGYHVETDPQVPGKDRMYGPGDIFESNTDLLAPPNNFPPDHPSFKMGVDHNCGIDAPRKFERLMHDPIAELARDVATIKADVNPSTAATAQTPEAKSKWTVEQLNLKSVGELKRLAAEEKIETRHLSRKEDLIRVLLNAVV